MKVRLADMSSLELNASQRAILVRVNRYVARQAIVLSALKELRPDILLLAEGTTTVKELIQARALCATTPQSGLWGKENEGRYFVHDKGCRLTHTLTNEPLEWDAPDLTVFEKQWFVNYLEWLIRFDPNDASNRVAASLMDNENAGINDGVVAVLEHLLTLGLLG